MFNNLYMQYKIEVLKVDILMSLKELKPYEKILLAIIVLGGIASSVFSLVSFNKGSIISIGITVIGFILLFFIRNREPEQKRIVKEKVEPEANLRMEKVVQLLLKFDIDVKDEKQLDNLINQAQKEQLAYDYLSVIRNSFKGMKTYILLPIITIFLSEYFKNVGWELLLYRALLLVLVCSGFVLFISAFALNFNDILNPDIRNINSFIKDIEEIKVFSQKAEKAVEKIKSENAG